MGRFKRTPQSKDYGGHAHEGSGTYRTPLRESLSYQCRDCHTMRYVTRRELNRAARPRCLACGGTLTETDATAKKVLCQEAAQNTQAENELMENAHGAVQCLCKKRFRKHKALALHLQESLSCRELYVVYDKITSTADGKHFFFKGTFFLRRLGQSDWRLVALKIGDPPELFEIAQFRTLYQAEEEIRPFCISFLAARTIDEWKEVPSLQPSPPVRCPVCRIKFERDLTSGYSAHDFLCRHLAGNDECWKDCEDGELKQKVAARYPEQRHVKPPTH